MRNEKNKQLFQKLFKTKGMGFIIIGLLAGLALLIIPREGSEEAVLTESPSTGMEYCALLEAKAEELIKRLPNVKDCSVFITLESGYRYVYATDQHVRETSDSKETDKTIVLAGNGNGDSPILIQETLPTVAGVAVVCTEATYETQYKIVELVCALFDIPSNRISIQT